MRLQFSLISKQNKQKKKKKKKNVEIQQYAVRTKLDMNETKLTKPFLVCPYTTTSSGLVEINPHFAKSDVKVSWL